MAYAAESLETYLADAASNKPAPGGGSVSALVGALAGAMSEMAANFTVGKKKYEAVQPQIRACLARLEACRRDLLSLVDADVRCYSAVAQAYALPNATPQEQAARAAAIQDALKGAMDVPLRVVRQCCAVARTAAELVSIANRNLLTDVGVSALLARAACEAARLNVEVNLKFIKDELLVGRVRQEVDQASHTVAACCTQVVDAVAAYLAQ
jgi:formiminotetrahydrofolate cyclodeaminase